MAFTIPSGIFDTYYEACDEFINNNYIGKSCTVVYPPKKESCECTLNPIGFGSSNVFSHGGPMPKAFNDCPLCGGNGYRETETTDTLRLRIYWSRKDWIKVGNIMIPDADAQIIGFSSDLYKIKNAAYILLINEQLHSELRFTLDGEPLLHGFGKNRYFIGFVKRA